MFQTKSRHNSLTHVKLIRPKALRRFNFNLFLIRLKTSTKLIDQSLPAQLLILLINEIS